MGNKFYSYGDMIPITVKTRLRCKNDPGTDFKAPLTSRS
jgi:hypothetical protein